jgi:hypothetical protein
MPRLFLSRNIEDGNGRAGLLVGGEQAVRRLARRLLHSFVASAEEQHAQREGPVAAGEQAFPHFVRPF